MLSAKESELWGEKALGSGAWVSARQGAFLTVTMSHQGSNIASQKCLTLMENHRSRAPQLFLQDFAAKRFCSADPRDSHLIREIFRFFWASTQKTCEPAFYRQGDCLLWALAGEL